MCGGACWRYHVPNSYCCRRDRYLHYNRTLQAPYRMTLLGSQCVRQTSGSCWNESALCSWASNRRRALHTIFYPQHGFLSPLQLPPTCVVVSTPAHASSDILLLSHTLLTADFTNKLGCLENRRPLEQSPLLRNTTRTFDNVCVHSNLNFITFRHASIPRPTLIESNT